MFSLIIVLVSIALVAALALATIYYGGDSFTESQARASAAKISLQGQQVLGAAEVFSVQQGRWPDSVQELVDLGYLSTVPSVDSTVAMNLPAVVPQALAASYTWVMPSAGVPVFTLEGIDSVSVCQEINLRSFGVSGILTKAYTSLSTQCYGSTKEALTVVISKVAGELSTALPADQVQNGPVPSDPESGEWLVAPGETVTPPSGGGGGSTPPATDPTLGDDIPYEQAGALEYFGETPLFFSGNNSSKSIEVYGPNLGAAVGGQLAYTVEAPAGLVVTLTGINCEQYEPGNGGCQATVTASTTVTLPSATVVQGAITLTGTDGSVRLPFRYLTQGFGAHWVMSVQGTSVVLRSAYLDPVRGANAVMHVSAPGDSDPAGYSNSPSFSGSNQVTYDFGAAGVTSMPQPTRVYVNPDLFRSGGPYVDGLFVVPSGSACVAYTLAGLESINCAQFSSYPLRSN